MGLLPLVVVVILYDDMHVPMECMSVITVSIHNRLNNSIRALFAY